MATTECGVDRLACRYAAGQIGHGGTPVATGVFVDTDEISESSHEDSRRRITSRTFTQRLYQRLERIAFHTLSKPSAQASTTSGGWANKGYDCEPMTSDASSAAAAFG
jgi:hypothetical protein